MKTTILKSRSVRALDGTPGSIEYGLHYLNGNHDAYFSITAWFKGMNRDGVRGEFGGACRDEIAAIAPDLQPFIDLHLSDSDGVPMHSEANALYHAGIGRYSSYSPRYLASHLRISDECADMLCERRNADEIRDLIAALKPQWKAQAERAKAMIAAASEAP